MSRRRTSQLIAAQYYSWRLTRRNGVWCADGRTNSTNIGRHSLGTRNEIEAKRLLVDLDLRCAIAHGRAQPSSTHDVNVRELPLADGRRLYLEFVARPRVVGGIRAVSQKRYRAIFDKFLPFAVEKGLRTWNAVNGSLIEQYLGRLERDNYAYATQYLEGTTLKQAIGWLVENGHLSHTKPIDLRLKKPNGTNTHCWTPEEFRSIVAFCRSRDELGWLASIVIALGATGLRISELADLRWDDLDFANGMVHLADESTQPGKGGRPPGGRTTKSGRSRSLPINAELKAVLAGLTRHRDGFVFHGPQGGRVKPDTIRNILIRSVLRPISRDSESLITEKFLDGRLHSFRHYFCSMCANGGVSQQVVMHWLGHRESAMVQHYYHLHDAEAKRQMERLNMGITAGALPVE